MYAVVNVAGSQVKVREGDRVQVSRMEAGVGEKLTLENVLLVSDGGEVQVGTPHVAGATVAAHVVAHGREDTVRVFKMKRRKGSRRQRGHRQDFTEIEIDGISAVPSEPEDKEAEDGT
jgi:large subunit ribosomal protein L21